MGGVPVFEIFAEALTGSLRSILQMACFIIPIMIFIEVLRDLNVLHRFAGLFSPLTRLYRMPAEASLPLLAGLIFGIAYGAGVILQTVREGRLELRDIYIVNVFLVICHGIIDDTVIFIAIGAQGLWIVLPRVITALVVCYFLSRILEPAERPELPRTPATPGTGT